MCGNIPNIFYGKACYLAERAYDTSITFAGYILSTSEILGGWIGNGSAHSFIFAAHAFEWLHTQIELAGGAIIGWGAVRLADLSQKGKVYAYESLLQVVENIGGVFGHASSLLYQAVNRCALAIFHAVDALGEGIGFLATIIGANLLEARKLTIHFIREDWEYILAHLAAWTIVIVCSGIIYGFESVTLPLIIGLGCGLFFGGLTGILTVKIFNQDDSAQGRNTAWDALNHYLLDRLPSTGVKTLLASLSVTVLLAAAVVYPYAIGAIFGLVVGNHLITVIGFKRNLTDLNRESVERLREKAQDQINQAQKFLNQAQKFLKRSNELENN